MSSFIGYESPITRIMGDIQTQIIQEGENQIFQAVQKYDVKVDREELIKALNYDREQYDKGYKDGRKEIFVEELEKIKAEFEDKILLNQTVAIQIIDKHIEELKGENK